MQFAKEFLEELRYLKNRAASEARGIFTPWATEEDRFIGGFLNAVEEGGDAAVKKWQAAADAFKPPENVPIAEVKGILAEESEMVAAQAAKEGASSAARLGRRAGTVSLEVLGHSLLIGAIAYDTYDVLTSSNPFEKTTEKVGQWTGGAMGAAWGATEGSAFGPVGTFVGLLIGGAAGTLAGEEGACAVFSPLRTIEETEQHAKEVIKKYGGTTLTINGPASWLQIIGTLGRIVDESQNGDWVWP